MSVLIIGKYGLKHFKTEQIYGIIYPLETKRILKIGLTGLGRIEI